MQVNSEFQAFKHVEILGPGEHMRAQQPLEATLAIHPTVVLTNALPYPMHLILWQVCALLRVAVLPLGYRNQLPRQSWASCCGRVGAVPLTCGCCFRATDPLADANFATRFVAAANTRLYLGAQVAPLHRGQKQSASLKRTASSPAHSGGSADVSGASATAAAAAAGRARDSETGDFGGSPDHARRLQELAAVLSGTLPMGPEDNLLLEELLKVGFWKSKVGIHETTCWSRRSS